MIAYKGFEPGLVCRGYQFVMGRNTTEEANCVRNGFHCAKDPLDCLTYYRDMDSSEYYVVDCQGDINEDGVDTKIACTELVILKKLSKEEFFMHALAYMADHPKLSSNHNVSRERTVARNGYAVVRGPDPVASGGMGDILAFAKEQPGKKEIAQVSLATVDGKEYLPGVWYGADLVEREGC